MSAIRQKLVGYSQPSDWICGKLESLVTLHRGFDLPKRNRKKGVVPIVTSSGIEDFHAEFKVLSPGVVTGRYGTIGNVYYLDEDFWPLNTTLFVSNFHGNNPRFVSHFLKTVDFETHSGKSGVPGINRNDLHQEVVYFPPTLAEQEAIASALSDADALIESLEQLLAKKRLIQQGTMQELLTGRRRLPGFAISQDRVETEIGPIPAEWELANIEDCASITTGSRNTQDRIAGGKYPFFVRSQTIERINDYSFDGEAVLTAGDGVGTGKVFHYIDGKFDLHQRVYRIAEFDEKLNGYFFYLYFSNHFYDRIMQMTAKSSVDSVRRDMIARMLIPLPTRQEQDAISAVILELNEEVQLLETKLFKSRQLKQAMMQQLLTGRIRLV